MQLKAVSDRILVEKDPKQQLTAADGRLIIIDSDQADQAYMATVVDVGPGRWTDDRGQFLRPTVEVGDRVLIAGHAVGHPLPQRIEKIVGDRFAFVFEEEILARVDDSRMLIASEEELTALLGAQATKELLQALELSRATPETAVN